jgi:murein DD-endopeptidase MepM/ murein hydrolase activator NlpD
MIGAKPTPNNLRFLANWQRWEGGHTKNKATFNWLNTTTDAPGVVGSINSVGVKAFRDKNSGINALASTMLNGRYNDIVKALRAGNPYGYDINAGLSTWVSGSPDGNLEYARKVLGGTGGSSAPRPRGGRGLASNPGLPAGPPGLNMDPLRIAFADDPEFLALLEQVNQEPEPTPLPGPELERRTSYRGKKLVLPTRWKATHPTDGLGWGTNTAADIMARAGTPVGAPEAGVIVKWNPTGAQGGGSMYFKAKSGRVYWLGHIADGLPPGTKVRRGQVIAVVSADHPRPHVHIDKR